MINNILSRANNANLIVIKAGNKGFFYDGFTAGGYKVYSPYKEKNILERLLREIWFRTPFLSPQKWFNPEIAKSSNVEYVLIWDPLITISFLEWIHTCFPNAQLNYIYGNMVGRTTHLYPNQVPSYYRLWTYDAYDAQKYNLRIHNPVYFEKLVKPLQKPIYDILFVGADKGRGEYLMKLSEELEKRNKTPKFVIVRDGRLAKIKSYYQKYLSYDKYTDLVVRSKSILNITMPNQQGLSLRDMEALFFGIKLVTTNKHIKEMDFYKKNNFFVLEKNNIEDLIEFLDAPYIKVPEEIKNCYTLENFIQNITK